MPKPVLPTPEIDDESAGTDRPPISTDTEAERQPSTIDAADETLNDIDQDLVELEALFSSPDASTPKAPEGEPAASVDAPSRTEVSEEFNSQKSIDRRGKKSSLVMDEADGPPAAAEEEDEAVGADPPGSWDDTDGTYADRGPSEDVLSGTRPSSPPDDEDWETPSCFTRLRHALRLTCRSGAPYLASLLDVLDRPFRLVSVRVKALLGYVAWATLAVSLGVWMYALWAA